MQADHVAVLFSGSTLQQTQIQPLTGWQSHRSSEFEAIGSVLLNSMARCRHRFGDIGHRDANIPLLGVSPDISSICITACT